MKPRITILPELKLVGNRIDMSFTENKTATLWRSFMPRRKTILNTVGIALYSVEIYPEGFFANFNPTKSFEKWAAVEVTDFETVPDGMETLVIPEGHYAVFLHKGAAGEGEKTYRYIFETWLPQSGYTLAKRPHFALMDERYKHESPESEEEIWIPIN